MNLREEIVKRFGCAECGHSFAMECETPDMIPKFCPFCANPVYIRDVDEDDEYDDRTMMVFIYE